MRNPVRVWLRKRKACKLEAVEKERYVLYHDLYTYQLDPANCKMNSSMKLEETE